MLLFTEEKIYHVSLVINYRDDNDGFHMSSTPSLLSGKQSVFYDTLYEEKSMSQLYDESTKEKLMIEVSHIRLHDLYVNFVTFYFVVHEI